MHHLPAIKRRFFLRRWIDRLAIECIRIEKDVKIGDATRKLARRIPIGFYLLSPALFFGSCIVGTIHPSLWSAGGIALAILALPLQWALRPWVLTADESTIRMLVPNQYQLIETFATPALIDDLAAWALIDQNFDTRHLNACIDWNVRSDHDFYEAKPYRGTNALGLFDGRVGARVRASQHGQHLQETTPSVAESPVGRRL